MNKQYKISFNTHSSINVSLWCGRENKSPARKRKATRPTPAVSPLVSQPVLGSEFTPPPSHTQITERSYTCAQPSTCQPLARKGRAVPWYLCYLCHLTLHPPQSDVHVRVLLLCHISACCATAFFPLPAFFPLDFFLGGLKDAGHISMRDLWIDNFLWCLSPASYILQ